MTSRRDITQYVWTYSFLICSSVIAKVRPWIRPFILFLYFVLWWETNYFHSKRGPNALEQIRQCLQHTSNMMYDNSQYTFAAQPNQPTYYTHNPSPSSPSRHNVQTSPWRQQAHWISPPMLSLPLFCCVVVDHALPLWNPRWYQIQFPPVSPIVLGLVESSCRPDGIVYNRFVACMPWNGEVGRGVITRPKWVSNSRKKSNTCTMTGLIITTLREGH